MASKKVNLFLRGSIMVPIVLIVLLGLKLIEPNGFWWAVIIGSIVISVFIFVYNLLSEPHIDD
jgi:hypothetical protein